MLGRNPRDGVGGTLGFGMALPLERAGRIPASGPSAFSPVRGETPCLDLTRTAVAWSIGGLFSWGALIGVVRLLDWALGALL